MLDDEGFYSVAIGLWDLLYQYISLGINNLAVLGSMYLINVICSDFVTLLTTNVSFLTESLYFISSKLSNKCRQLW